MIETDNIYYSLDDARAELARRWADVALRQRMEAELGMNFMPEFRNHPRGTIGRQLISPDFALTLFVQLSNYVGTTPFAWEYHGDKFSRSNNEKGGLGRLRVSDADGSGKLLDIISRHASNQKPLGDVMTYTGETLTTFHHRLLRLSGLDLECRDMTKWYHENGKPSEYYYPYLKHFIAHGVLFDCFDVETEYEKKFTKEVVEPIFFKIRDECGFTPIVVRLYPENQTPEEDFYWWSYPRPINDYLLEMATEFKLPLRDVK